MGEGKKLLQIQDLSVEYVTDDGTVHAVSRLDLEVDRGESLGLVGEDLIE